MQKKYIKQLLSLVITIELVACSSNTLPTPNNAVPYYDMKTHDYVYCQSESCPQPTQFTVDNEEEHKPIFIEPVVVEEKKIDITVNYDFSKSYLHPNQKAKIRQQIEAYKARDINIEIVGYTDSVESNKTKSYNSKLARARALAVKKYLISLGVKASDITVVGRPLCCYISTNKTSKGRALNRRADIKIIIKN